MEEMGQLGRTKDGFYPDLTISEAADLVRQLVDVGGHISQTGLAKIAGIDPRGHGLSTRVTDLKAYGLVEGNGELQVTQLGEQVASGNSGKIWEAFTNIPLYAKMHERLKGKEPPDKVVLQTILYDITKADSDPISRRAARLRNNYVEALQYFSSGGPAVDRVTQPTGGRGTATQPPPTTPFPVMDSDFYIVDKRQKVFITIENMDNLALALQHLENAKKRFQEKRTADKKGSATLEAETQPGTKT